jgi:nucleotide-binding universal stress UspA family protein
MIALKNVLVATDFSEPAALALEYGRHLARQYAARLHVFHAIDDIRLRYSLDMTQGLLMGVQEDLEATARDAMQTLVTNEDHLQLGAAVTMEISTSPATAIVEYAKRAAIDVIVVGTSGRGGLSHMLLGSVAERIVRMAPCPVLTVRSPERDFIAPDALTLAEKV